MDGILKVNGYVAASEGIEEQPAVINGASDVLHEIFGDLNELHLLWQQ